MEGDLANLPKIVELKHKYNCSIMVDEAHGLGVFGKEGRGVCDYFGLTDEIDLIMGTFSKSMASIGGFIAGDKDTIFVIHAVHISLVRLTLLLLQQLLLRHCTSSRRSLSALRNSGRLPIMHCDASRKKDLR